jgi:cysteine sulfinate desulfinase/cysteine desulfurase-like protein
MHDEMIDGAAARRILSHRTYLADLREQELELRANVVKQEKVVEKAESEVEKALELLTEATKEVKVIEKHKETWRVNLKKETERKEQKLNDEIGAILFQEIKAEACALVRTSAFAYCSSTSACLSRARSKIFNCVSSRASTVPTSLSMTQPPAETFGSGSK